MITYLRFHAPISIGSNEIDYWSGLGSNTNSLHKAITVEDRGDKGVVLRYRAGASEHDVEVRWSNIAQITRPPEKTAQLQQGAKKP